MHPEHYPAKVLLAAAFALHWCLALLHPILALALGTGWACAAATAARKKKRARRGAWLTLLAALQLCDAAGGSLALLAWHRLPWGHRQWAHVAEAETAAQAAYAAMMLYVTGITTASFWPEDSSPWLITALRRVLRPVMESAIVALIALVVTIGSLGVQLGLPASNVIFDRPGLDVAPNINVGTALAVLYIWKAARPTDAPARLHTD